MIIKCLLFQKESPYLEDFNSLIHLGKQMGLIEKSYNYHLPNATECKTIRDVYNSHAKRNHKVVVEVNDIYGMMGLLGLGVGWSLATFIAEVAHITALKVLKRRQKAKRRGI